MLLYIVTAAAAVHGGTLVAWIVENGSIALLAVLKCAVMEASPTWWGFGLSNVIIVEGAILAQSLINRTVYRSTPPMHETAHGVSDMWRNIVQSTLPVHVASTLAVACTSMPADYRLADDVATFDGASYIAMLVVFRLVSDVVFYVAHRWQHTHSRVYLALHARHHRHRLTSLRTNFQFTAIDLFLEGSLPYIVATAVVATVWQPSEVTPLKATLCLACMQWYQIGSHNAKDVPCVTALPPLAPLYNHRWAKAWRPTATLRNHRHIPFHATHHRKVLGNYGISPWMDVLCGTQVKLQK